MATLRKRYSKISSFIGGYEVGNAFSGRRFIIIYIFISIIFIILIFRLFVLQIVHGGEYLAAANQNYKNKTVIRAPRGLILDSDGVKLAYNINKYSVFVNSFDFDMRDLTKLANITKINVKVLSNMLKNDQVYGRVSIISGLSLNKYLTISSRIKDIKGVYTEASIGRGYIEPYLYSNIIGYLGSASKGDLSDEIDGHSIVGKSGLENLFDEQIRGNDGIEIHEISINHGKDKSYVPKSAEPGDNIILNLDNNWQTLAYQVLKNKVIATKGLGGAFSIMETDTGKVRVMASYPTINLDEFSNGISYDAFSKLLKDPGTPLLERNVNVALPTGSIFKVITASMALEENVINKDTIFYSDGCMKLSGNQQLCESFFRHLGNVDIFRAIKLSSNIYFCNVAIKLEKSFGGINTFLRYTDKFHIGKKTGIDMIGENIGAMSTPKLKRELLRAPWYTGDTCNVAIGQGLMSATPMQMLVATASIENGGHMLKPLLIDKIEDPNGNVVKQFSKKEYDKIPVSVENLDIVKKAMRKAIRDSDGTVRQLNFYDNYIIGKTGTATSPVRVDGILYDAPHAWVIGVFEKNKIRYAFVINIAHGGWGETAVEVIAKFLQSV